MMDAGAAVDVFLQAAELNLQDHLRAGSLLLFPDYGQVVMTGDLHGHRRNYEKLVRFCNLERAAARHVLLHELIHDEPKAVHHVDTTHRILFDAARWKIEYPDQVHFLQSNHELAQVTGHEVLKSGRSVIRGFEAGLAQDYGTSSARVLEAIGAFVRSYALAAKTPRRILLSHSLPSTNEIERFNPAILSRPLTDEDFAEHGPAHGMIWGRRQTSDVLNRLARALDVDLFVVGHQSQESGYAVHHHRLLILASDHNHGVFLPIDLKKTYSLEELITGIRPFSAVP